MPKCGLSIAKMVKPLEMLEKLEMFQGKSLGFLFVFKIFWGEVKTSGDGKNSQLYFTYQEQL